MNLIASQVLPVCTASPLVEHNSQTTTGPAAGDFCGGAGCDARGPVQITGAALWKD
jgi:hypothetical protein